MIDHVTVNAADLNRSRRFYEQALALLGYEPGVREMYHPDYYGAFVLDPDGNNVEAVCRRRA